LAIRFSSKHPLTCGLSPAFPPFQCV